MDDSGHFRFPGNLDPRAQEYFPTNPFGSVLPPHVYVPLYRSAPPYPPLAAAPLQSPYLPPPSQTPTRALLISMVSPDVSEWLVRRDLEVLGDVRAVEMDRVREGIVAVHFYDLRHAEAALFDIQQQHMQQQYRLRLHYDSKNLLPPPLPPPARGLIGGRAVWAQFTIPVADWNNQGTLVIFNLDPHVSPSHLKHIFETFGIVKELRETPMKRHQRFVEFYDVRDAAKALSEMNQKEINCKKILIRYSRPGGYGSSSSSSRFPKITQNPNNNYARRFSQPEPQVGPRCYRSSKKWRPSKGNPSGGSIEDSMESLCINRNGSGSGSGSSNSCGGSSSSSSSSSKTNRRRTWKGVMKKQAKDHDPRFLINGDASHSKDLRTTVMIKNIPNKYSQKLLLNMLDNHCIHCNEQIAATHGSDDHHHPKSSYDFVYLPIDFINKCNVGYGFVNMTSPQATWRLYNAFHQQTWEVFNSRKICEVTYARLQGLEALKEHFKNSKFPCEAEEYMPVLFSPPRDGNTLTLPLPIVGLTSKEEEEELLGNDEMTEKLY